ncbi:MAG: hypothetical protein AAGH68_13275 [Pseudomonadota bacterium]
MGLHETAAALLANRDGGHEITAEAWAATGLAPSDETQGYAAQAAMAQLLTEAGQTCIGYKIGATNATARGMLGVETPFYGRLWSGQTVDAPQTLDFKPWLHRVAEPEVAIRMAQDVSALDGPVDADTIRAATAEVLPVVEIVATPFSPWMQAGAPNIVADNGAHGIWIKGEGRADWPGFDALELPVTARRTAGDDHHGKGGAVDGGCFGAAAWLANKLAEHGQILKAGDYVSTGTATPPIPLVVGDLLSCDFGDLGGLEVTVSA